MEIANEIKAKVFAQYLGQQMGYYDGTVHQPPILSKFQLTEVGIYLTKPYNRHKLILKPLSAITDEEIIDLNRLLTLNYSKHLTETSDAKIFIEHILDEGSLDVVHYHMYRIIQAIQFLQSCGYDLPNYLLNGKTLHQAGLAIYE